MLPNLLIIGSAKSGTTSLHKYLSLHPEIHMAWPNGVGGTGGRAVNDARPKEMRFFWRDDWREQLDWYAAHFDVDAPVRGEATPAYSAHPHHLGVPQRISAVIPEARLVYLVRDPVDRVVAHWVQARVDGDRRPLESVLDAPGWEDDPIVCPSRYATQLEQYLECFAPEQLLVVDQTDLRSRRRETLSRVFGFLGVDAGFWTPEFDTDQNTRADKRELTSLGGPLYRRVLDPAGRRLAPASWQRARPRARHALSRPVTERPVIEADAMERLRALLAPEAQRLRDLTGQQFTGWSV
jgi:hypothetical protein